MIFLKIIILILLVFLVGLVIYNNKIRREKNISDKDYIDIKNKVQDKKITSIFLICFIILLCSLIAFAVFYFFTLFGLPATESIAKKTGTIIDIVFKTWICETVTLLLVLLIKQILLTKYLNKMNSDK